MEKIAFVFDTNFIVQHKKLKEVISNLDEKYIPYITQVSIEERKAQKCIEKKKDYDKMKELLPKIKAFVSLNTDTTLEKELERLKEYTQKSYECLFEHRIINYKTTSKVFKNILERAYSKIPPFNDSDNASDKGFKDTLMWLTMMEYFKENGENEILFLTDDNGFISKKSVLKDEFEKFTGKKITIERNAYINDISLKTDPPKKESNVELKKEIKNIETIRKQLSDILEGICLIPQYDYFGNVNLEKSFLTKIEFDSDYIQTIMENMGNVIQEHMFNDYIKVSLFLDIDGRIFVDDKVDIKIVESLYNLYNDILKEYPEHIKAFLNMIAETLNDNYQKPEYIKSVSDYDLPF